MTRQNYINEINKALNEIEGNRKYDFHHMTADDAMKVFRETSENAVGLLIPYTMKSVTKAKEEFARMAAMCMICMEVSDFMITIIKKQECVKGDGVDKM